MPFSLLPKLISPSLTHLTPELLREKGVRLLMLDFDNTIVPYTTSVPTPEMAALVTFTAAASAPPVRMRAAER